jgi:hypothetical protein
VGAVTLFNMNEMDPSASLKASFFRRHRNLLATALALALVLFAGVGLINTRIHVPYNKADQARAYATLQATLKKASK